MKIFVEQKNYLPQKTSPDKSSFIVYKPIRKNVLDWEMLKMMI